jgi:hypothetical protein
MADASKLRRLGAPPSIDEARVDLVPEPPIPDTTPPPAAVAPAQNPRPEPDDDFDRIDGRSLRKTGRTLPFSTRVSVDLDRRIRRIAAKHHMLIVEIIEQGVDLLEEKLNNK